MITEYEAIFIFNTQEDLYNSSKEKIKALFTENEVKTLKETDMGVKRLGYAVKKKLDGHYFLFNIKVEGSKIKNLSKEINLIEIILKHMFVKIEFKKPHKYKKVIPA